MNYIIRWWGISIKINQTIAGGDSGKDMDEEGCLDSSSSPFSFNPPLNIIGIYDYAFLGVENIIMGEERGEEGQDSR